MNYFDPARPQLAEGVPCYVDLQGKPIAALQEISVRPLPGKGFELSIMLMCGFNTARWYEARTENWVGVARTLVNYREDPEKTLKDVFNYEFKIAPPPQPTKHTPGKISNINIDDLFTP